MTVRFFIELNEDPLGLADKIDSVTIEMNCRPMDGDIVQIQTFADYNFNMTEFGYLERRRLVVTDCNIYSDELIVMIKER